MINRYQGNSGRVVKIEEQGGPRVYAERPRPTAPPPHTPGPGSKGPAPHPAAPSQRVRSGPPGGLGVQNILSGLSKFLPHGSGKMSELETEDIILLLILYLMYRESGDSELLMMMGAMFLL